MLTPDAKKLLAETIRGTAQDPEKGIRGRLLRAIHDEADRQYRLSVPIDEAKLDEMHAARRKRIEAWIGEGARAAKPKNKSELKATTERLQAQAEKEAAATLVNRLVLLRHLEALGLSKPAVVTGGWNSKGYREFREFAPTLCTNGTTDATEGYSTLLQLLFDELAVDLPGLFGDVGLTKLFPIPASALREVIERLDDPGLVSAWTDDTTLGWVYQSWNDFERDGLDEKILGGGKIEPHEIASKTQMFTDRYIVEWLLQNSLGLTWLTMCRRHRWTADADRVLPLLDSRRANWRNKREAGEVALDALMPIDGELEEQWKYYVPQPIHQGAIDKAPESVRAIKILDPACGSGHFLVIAFGLLAALYREEARHLGIKVTDKAIAESILENNLHGIDIDPRAIQIAAAGLFLKAKSFAKDSRPKKLNLVAPVLQLGNLPPGDPAVMTLRQELKREAGIPEELTTKVLSALAGVDYLGSLLKVDAAVEDAIKNFELEFERTHGQGNLFGGFPAQQVKLSIPEAKATILDKVEHFLAAHSKSEDLGLRLDGEQLAIGVRFARMLREGIYDVVVGNPPYQGLAKTESLGYVTRTYPRGKTDLCSAFLERSIELARPGGLSAMVAMRGWMFLSDFTGLRRYLLHTYDLRLLGDLDKGAFETMATSQLISVAMTIFRVASPSVNESIALQPTAPGEKYWGPDRTDLKRAAVLAQRGRSEFDPRGFEVIEGEPLVYWWTREFLKRYSEAPKLGQSNELLQGIATTRNSRFLLSHWEIPAAKVSRERVGEAARHVPIGDWVPYIKGADGKRWFEPLSHVLRWSQGALELDVCLDHYRESHPALHIKAKELFFRPAVAYSTIGAVFSARLHRYRSIFDVSGSSVFVSANGATIVCTLNSKLAQDVLSSLNPSVNFQLADIRRMPMVWGHDARPICARLDSAFSEHESHRENSAEFTHPGRSAWRYAEGWAQQAVDRPEDNPLPPYEPDYDAPTPQSFVSFVVGVALGRFGSDGEGILDVAKKTALANGILFVSSEGADSLDDPACARLPSAWKEHGAAVGEGDDMRTYLRKSFFDLHKKLYEKRPIYFPLSSAKKSFVALVSIHRWQDDTLNVLLADHLVPAKRRLDGELEDLRIARASGNNKGKAEKRLTEVQKLLEELSDFIAKVTEVAEKGPPSSDEKTQKRHADARFVMDLDDGVMVNSAALWPLLEPQWKEPKKWWKELANAVGKKNHDWSHLAARYFPKRVRAKCHTDPSLAVAHKCFWELHPLKAYAWELRLQDEIRPDFTIDESGSNEARKTFLADHAREAHDIRAKELKRREKKSAKADDEGDGPLFNQEADAPEESDD